MVDDLQRLTRWTDHVAARWEKKCLYSAANKQRGKIQIFQTRLFRTIHFDSYSISSCCCDSIFLICDEIIIKKMGTHAKRAVIDFCVHLGKNWQEMHRLMREAYKEECFAKQTIQYWYKLFSDSLWGAVGLNRQLLKSTWILSQPQSWRIDTILPWISIVTTSNVQLCIHLQTSCLQNGFAITMFV